MRRILVIAGMLLIGSIAFALFAGNGVISSADILGVICGGGTQAQRLIVYQVRLPRLIASLSAGAALAVSGYLLQNSLNNLIASPGLLGINHGAGLSVLISALLFPYKYGIKSIFAFAGALAVTILCYSLSAGTGMTKSSVILSGVAITAICAAFTDVIISFRPETVADKAAFQIGGFSSVSPMSVIIAVPVILLSLAIAHLTAPVLDVMALGDETAHALGVNVRAYRGVFIVSAALLAGASVSMCGLIGFAGLMVPNIVRLICHGNSRVRILLTTVAGAAFLTFCDTVSRILAFPYELPCGLILSCLGAPFLVWILIKKRKRLGIE